MPFSSWADTASRSDAIRVATSSDALPSQDYMESDDFDSVSIAPLSISGSGHWPASDISLSSGGGYFATVTGAYKGSSAGYDWYSWPTQPSNRQYSNVYVYLDKNYFPKPGTYGVTFKFAVGDINFTSNRSIIYVRSGGTNITEGVSSANGVITKSSGVFTCTGNVKIDYNTTRVGLCIMISEQLRNLDIGIPTSDFVSFTFKPVDGETAIPPSSQSGGSSAQDAIADNTAQQVEQGDTIIELIKNTIQTISSQLTAFWNQLAGEFTNLYNKMNAQHTEQLEADRTNTDDIISADNANTDKVTGAIEKHGNFIIEGLKSLFIPSDEYFKSWFDGMYQFFNDRLGFLMLPVDLLVRMVDIYTSAGSSSAGIPFPEFKWMDGTVIIPAQTVQFDFLNTDWGKGIQDKLYFVGNLIMIGALLSLMHRKFEEVLRN